LPQQLKLPESFTEPAMVMAGILAITARLYTTAAEAAQNIAELNQSLKDQQLDGIALIVICDDSKFTAATINNFVWVTFTRSNPATDINGIGAFVKDKHWGCTGPLIIDARKKPHHAPELIMDKDVEENIKRFNF